MNKKPQVGVGAFIVKNNKLLLGKRHRAPEKDHWSILGGKVEYFETIEAAIHREVLEESGITITLHELLCVTNHILENESMHFVSPTFYATTTDSFTVTEPTKINPMGWFDLDDLPEPLTETTLNALKHYKKMIRK